MATTVYTPKNGVATDTNRETLYLNTDKGTSAFNINSLLSPEELAGAGGAANGTSLARQKLQSQYGIDIGSLNAFNKADLDQQTLAKYGGGTNGMAQYLTGNINDYVNQPNATYNPTQVNTDPSIMANPNAAMQIPNAAPAQTPSTAPSPFGANYGPLGVPNQPAGTPATAPGTTPAPGQGAAAPVSPDKPALTMPANGSVVDLLNAAGQDSSQAARKALAQQYGIQSYDFSADKNKELADKFLAAYNDSKDKKTPQTPAAANSALDTYFEENSKSGAQDPTKSFMDSFADMNPIESNLFQQLATLSSSVNNQQSLTDLYKQESAANGLPELKTELLDTNRIMEGSEDDIREEITKSGGFATDSQVQALTTARNKTLLKKASYLTDLIKVKDDYVNTIVNLTKADQEQVSKDLSNKLGISSQMITLSSNMESAARDNMKTLVSSIGYNGIAELLQNDPAGRAQAEKTLGLPADALSNSAFLNAAVGKKELTTQIVEVDGRKALVTYDKSGNPTNLVDLGSAASAGSGGLTPGQVNAFNSIVGKYNASPLVQASDRTAVLQGTIANIKKDPSNAAQQLNLAYSYVQALDTYQSAVREGELGLVNSIDSKVGQIKNSIDQIQNGQIVRPEVALQIASAAQNVVDTINSAAKQKAKSFESQANVVGLGSYWNQYVSGFNQGYNNTTNTAKGNQTSAQYVESTLTKSGVSYQKVLEDTPLGRVGVIYNDSGEIGSIDPSEFDPAVYTRI